MAHWKGILGDDTITKKTALIEGQVAGNVVSFEHGVNARSSTARERILGQSVATAALSAFLRLVRVRPLYASVAEHNAACIRVLINAGSRYLAKTLAPPISLAKRPRGLSWDLETKGIQRDDPGTPPGNTPVRDAGLS